MEDATYSQVLLLDTNRVQTHVSKPKSCYLEMLESHRLVQRNETTIGRPEVLPLNWGTGGLPRTGVGLVFLQNNSETFGQLSPEHREMGLCRSLLERTSSLSIFCCGSAQEDGNQGFGSHSTF